MVKKNRLLLIDTFYFLHRSFHAFPKSLRTSKGEHTNMIFGFVQALLDSISDLNPTHIACGWESEELPSFRKELYPEYQITRVPMEPEEERLFVGQLPRVIQVLETFNIPRLMENGFEGDDVLGTAAVKGSRKAEVVISTSDQDLLQLVTDKILVYRPARLPYVKKQLFDRETFVKKYGFEPHQMIDYKALRGDPSDNIPGVRGVGDKTAKMLIKQFGSVEEIYCVLEDRAGSSLKGTIPPAVTLKLKAGKESAFLSKQLATIITNIPMEFDLDACKVHDFDANEVRALFNELEFKSLLKKLDKLEKIKSIKSVLEGNRGTKRDAQIKLL